MDAFQTLFLNLIPLYFLIGLGWIAGRFYDVDRSSLGNLAINIIMPVVGFGFILKMDFRPEYLALPVIIYGIMTVVIFSFLFLGQKIYGDARANLLAMCATAGNTGYFGLPLALLFFSPETVAIYIFMMMGGVVFEATLTYYVAARGNFSRREALIKLSRFPVLYALLAAFALKMTGVTVPDLFFTYWAHFKGAYIVIGMMIIGVALSRVERLAINWPFMGFSFLGKFIVLPLLMVGVILFDRAVTGWFSPTVHQLMFLMSIVPPAANIAAFAVQMNLKPEKAATTVLIGTLLALFYIPAALWLGGKIGLSP